MPLKDQILSELQKAMKSGDKRRTQTLRGLKAALEEKEIEKRGSRAAMNADDEIAVLIQAAKKRRESIEMFQKGGRADLVQEEQEELAIIQEYLPEPITPGEMEKVIRSAITETGASGPADFGKVMPLVMKELKGKADGKLIQERVRSILSGE